MDKKNLRVVLSFLKNLKFNITYKTKYTIYDKNKKLMVLETIYKTYFCNSGTRQLLISELKQLIEFFYRDIDIEDLVCFMANIYPNKPYLQNTILFDLLKLYEISMVDWSLIRAHFKLKFSTIKKSLK